MSGEGLSECAQGGRKPTCENHSHNDVLILLIIVLGDQLLDFPDLCTGLTALPMCMCVTVGLFFQLATMALGLVFCFYFLHSPVSMV